MSLIKWVSFWALLLLCESIFSQHFYVERLDEGINSHQYHEISPVVSHDGGTLFFTRMGDPGFTKTLLHEGNPVAWENNSPEYKQTLISIYSQIAGKHIADPVYSPFNQDIFFSSLTQIGTFDNGIRLPYPVNNALPNSLCSQTPNPSLFVVVNQFTKAGGMRKGFSTVERRANGNWTFPQALSIDSFYTTGPEVSMTMDATGTILLISIIRDDSVGDNDLYVSRKKKDNSWTSPENIGPDINTTKREIAPFLSNDNTTLYFASNRTGAIGGVDIFTSNRLDESWKKWSRPKRLPSPINTRNDDSMPFLDTNTGYLYFCSNRSGTSDIYRSRITIPRKKDCVIKLKTIDTSNGKNISAGVIISKNNYTTESMLSATGEFKVFNVNEIKKISPSKQGYLSHDWTPVGWVECNQEIVLKMDPIVQNARISVNPIYFIQSQPIIHKESYPELDRITKLLRANKHIDILIEGHTDNSGDFQLLMKLSKQRAKAIKDHLVNSGINKERIETNGFGGTRPLNDNSTEELRRKNRRVEFKITRILAE